MGARWSWHAKCVNGHIFGNFSGGSDGECYEETCLAPLVEEYECWDGCPLCDPAKAAELAEAAALPAKYEALKRTARRVLDALDTCESNRGRFSCVDAHDGRCPKSRADSPEKWKGKWVCECGSEELDAALKDLTAALDEG